MMLEIVDKNVFNIMTLLNNLVHTCRNTCKTVIVCSVHSMGFVKFVFSTKIWFVKTSTRIVKYESRVVKSNPEI